MQKISCIVPIFNEASRVGAVLDVVASHPLIDEVIVVNDGSTDNSEELLKKRSDIKLISYAKNRGKTLALKEGFLAAANDMVILIDSDLIGLDAASVTALIDPVLNGQADITISLRKNALLIYLYFGLDFVSGERVFNKNILGDLEYLHKLPNFGFESYLNQIIIEKNLRLTVINWPKVISPRKAAKEGFYAGMKGDYKMVRQIVKLLTLTGVIKMFIKMHSIRRLVK
jgi:glycosyltransferase involved in cell wall biosynthesis